MAGYQVGGVEAQMAAERARKIEADRQRAAQNRQTQSPAYSGNLQTSSGGSVPASFPTSLDTVVTKNPSGLQQTTSAPNLGPQQHAFNVDELQTQGGIQGNLAKQQALAEQDLQRLKFGQSKEAFGDRLSAIQGLMGQGGANAPQVSFDQLGADEGAARAAAFARAKEQAGANALAGLKSVQNLAADRGMMGSSWEGQLEGQALGGGLGQLNDFTREQLIQDLNRNAQVSDMRYAGNITQRGQDLARQQALFGLLNQGGLY